MLLKKFETVILEIGEEKLIHKFNLAKLDHSAMSMFAAASKDSGGDMDKAKAAVISAGPVALAEIYDAAICAIEGYETDEKCKFAEMVEMVPLMHKIQAISALMAERFGGGGRKN